MVLRVDRDMWIDRVTKRGLKLFRQSSVFAQFTQTGGDGFDLMFVDDQTFEKIWNASEARAFGDIRAQVPCLDHLLALKLHALKQSLPNRTSKDANDVEVLLRRHQIDLADPHYKTIFLKYGTLELYETFVRLLRHP